MAGSKEDPRARKGETGLEAQLPGRLRLKDPKFKGSLRNSAKFSLRIFKTKG